MLLFLLSILDLPSHHLCTAKDLDSKRAKKSNNSVSRAASGAEGITNYYVRAKGRWKTFTADESLQLAKARVVKSLEGNYQNEQTL